MHDDDGGARASGSGEPLEVENAEVIARWSDARQAAEDFEKLLRSLGFTEDQARAVPGTGVGGVGMVRLTAEKDVIRWLGLVLSSVDLKSIPDSPFCGNL